MTEHSEESGDVARPTTSQRPGRPAEVARLVTMGTSGIVTFGLVGYFGLSNRQSSPDPGLVTPPVAIQPAVDGPTAVAAATAPAPTTTLGASAVSLATILSGATASPVPVAQVTAAPVPTAAPTTFPAPPPVEVVSEQSR